MMQSLRFPNLDMSRGIDQIFQQRVTKTHMPDGSTVQPAELTESAKVNLFLSLPSLDDYIAKRLRPALLDTGILVPAQFRLVLSETAASLRGRAQLNRKSAKRLGRLALLLDEEECLLELLQMYRSALLQG